MNDIRHPFSWTGGEAGDIVFAYSKGPGAWITRLGQRVLRGWPLRRAAPPSLYSHVAFVADFGVIIHADGRKTCFQALRDIAPAASPDADFRVVRPDPPLTRDQQDRMIASAERFMDQRYLFGFKLGTSTAGRWIRWWAGGSPGQSLPFCSQLVVLAYAAGGVPLVPMRAADEVLPMDLDALTRGPGWTDVTDLYYQEPLEAIFGRLGSAPSSPGPAEAAVTDNHLQFLRIRHDTHLGWNTVLDVQDASMGLHERFTETILASPRKVIELAPDFATRLVGEVDKAYRVALDFPGSFPASAIDLLAAATPYLPSDVAPLEGGLTLEEARTREQRHEASLFVNRVVRTHALMQAVAEEIVAMPNDLADWVYLLLHAVPPLGAARRKAVSTAIDRMAKALGEDDASVVRLRDILDMHAAFRRAVARPRRAAPPKL